MATVAMPVWRCPDCGSVFARTDADAEVYGMDIPVTCEDGAPCYPDTASMVIPLSIDAHGRISN